MVELSVWIEPIQAISLGCGDGQEDACFHNLWNSPTEELPRATAIRGSMGDDPGNGCRRYPHTAWGRPEDMLDTD